MAYNEAFKITPQLRFVTRQENIMGWQDGEKVATGYRNVKILQQAWEGELGTLKWEDVPLENEC